MTKKTPLFDRWVRTAKKQLAARGRKAELARHLAETYGRTPRSWEVYISAILGRRRLPNAEIQMAMASWLMVES